MAIGPSFVFEGFPQQCASLVMTKAAGIADQGVVRRDLVVLDAPSPVDEGKIEQFARFQRGLPQARFFDQSTNRVCWSRSSAFVELLEDGREAVKVTSRLPIVILENLSERGVAGAGRHQRQLAQYFLFGLANLREFDDVQLADSGQGHAVSWAMHDASRIQRVIVRPQMSRAGGGQI